MVTRAYGLYKIFPQNENNKNKTTKTNNLEAQLNSNFVQVASVEEGYCLVYFGSWDGDGVKCD